MKSALSAALLVSALLTSTACSTPRTENPPPPSTTTSNRFGAPEVPWQLDVAPIASAPCQTLFTASELVSMGATRPAAKEFMGARGCAWTVRGTDRLSLSVYAGRDLLADTYRAHLDPVFVPTTVEGFPAVRQKTGRGELNICTITTGLGSRDALDAVWVANGDPRPGNDACEFAEQATALVIRKLPPQR